jgi:hypothetical protein
MDEPVLIAVEVPQLGEDRHKNWAKVVHSVDVSRDTGWAFEGDFIAPGGVQDVPAGAVLLVYGERGSRANPTPHAGLFRANPDGTISPEATAKGRAWARTLRDKVVEMLDDGSLETGRPWDPALMAYTDDALREELRRRGT